MPSDVTTLGEIASRLSMLSIACNRCPRRGRLSVDRLLDEYGPGLPIPDLRRIVAVDCPKMIDAKPHDVCGVHFPGLSV